MKENCLIWLKNLIIFMNLLISNIGKTIFLSKNNKWHIFQFISMLNFFIIIINILYFKVFWDFIYLIMIAVFSKTLCYINTLIFVHIIIIFIPNYPFFQIIILRYLIDFRKFKPVITRKSLKYFFEIVALFPYKLIIFTNYFNIIVLGLMA